MANWTNLKSAISRAIASNNNQEITGQILQNTLISIINNVGENATFAGIAIPTTNPGIPDGPVFYLAFTPGLYSNFGGVSVADSAVFTWHEGTWKIDLVDLRATNTSGEINVGLVKNEQHYNGSSWVAGGGMNSLTEEGTYRGIYFETIIETFFLLVLNTKQANSAVISNRDGVIQIKVGYIDGVAVSFQSRIRYNKLDDLDTPIPGEYEWSTWENLRSGGAATVEAQAPLAQKDGKLSLEIGDGLKVENEKLVLDDFVREGAVAEYDEENKRLEFKGLGDTSTAVNSAKSLALREFFVAAGAEYNDGADKVRETPWAAYADAPGYKAVHNIDELNYTEADLHSIVQDGVTYKYVIDKGVYKVIGRGLNREIVHDDRYCVHRAGHYYLNGLGDITEQQMMTIYNNKTAFDIILAGLEVSTRLLQDIVIAPRTLLPPTGSLRRFDNKKIGGYYMVCAGVEVVDFAGGNWATNYIPDINAGDPVFYNCNKLVAISPFKISKAMNLFFNCPNLRYVAIKSNNSLNFKSSPYISKSSILFAINNSAATTAVTITLHPTAYTRLKDDTQVVAALANKPLVTLVSA